MSTARVLSLVPKAVEEEKQNLEQVLQKDKAVKSFALNILNNDSTVLLSKEEYVRVIDKVAKAVLEKFKNKDNLVFVTMLEGAAVFAGDVKRQLAELDPEFTYIEQSMKVGRYGDDEAGSKPEIKLMPEKKKIIGRTVVCLEDLIDEGVTILLVREELLKLGAKEVFFVTLMDKAEKNLDFKAQHNLKPLINGIEIKGSPWLIGAGMDQGGYLRQLRFVITKNQEPLKVVEAEPVGMTNKL